MERFSVSKSPVREALQGLMKAGLVEYRPRRGCYVKTVYPQDVHKHYIVRATLEGLAARLSYEQVAAEKIDELKKYYALMQNAADKSDLRAFLEHHDMFHYFFAENSANEVLAAFCKSLGIQNMRYRLQFLNLNLDSDLHTHDAILTRLERRDISAEDFSHLMHEHILGGLETFQRAMFINAGSASSTSS
jgi:DNA-binding GntR family transcriptional regulator